MEESLFIFGSFMLAAGLLGGIGYAIGRGRGRGAEGFGLGALLGPIGWLITIVLPEKGAKCPECFGVVPPAARKCKHCGSDLNQRAEPKRTEPPPPPPGEVYYLMLNDKAEGPFTKAQLSIFLDSGKVDRDALCAQNGDSNWRPLGDIL